MEDTTRILVVEDLLSDYELAQREIRKSVQNCVFERVEKQTKFLQALHEFQPDVIVCDYQLPAFTGLDALELVQKHSPSTPLIIWTGSTSEDIAVDCMKKGASNYIHKAHMKRLGPSIIHALEERRLLLERKQAEDALKNNEKRFRSLIENGLDDISLLDVDGNLLWESPATVRNLGYSRNQFVGQSMLAIMHPDDRGWATELFKELVQKPGSRQHQSFRLKRSDDTWRWVEAITTNMLNEPSVQAIVVNYRDVTERKQAEQAIRESEEKYRLLFESNPMPMWIYDLETLRFLKVNDAAVQSYGYSVEDFLGMTIKDIRPSEDVPKLLENIAISDKNTRQRVNRAGTWRHCKKDGTVIVVDIISHTVEFEGRKAEMVLANDVTVSKQAEIEVQQRNDDLELMNALNEAINRGESLDAVMKLLWDEAKRIFSSDYTTMYLLNPDGQSLKMQQFFLRMGITRKIEKLIGGPIPAIEIPIQEDGLFQIVMNKGRGTVISDPEIIKSWIGEFVETSFLSPAARGAIRKLIPHIFKILDIKSTILVPLISDGKTIGFLNVSSSHLLTEQDLKRIENISGQLTAAIRRKQVEDALNAERNLLRTLIDNLPDRIYVMDSEGRKTLSNTADWKASGGKTMEDVIGKTDFDTYPAELAEQFWKLDKVVLDSGTPVINYEEPGLDFDGNLVSILTTKIPLRNEDEKVIGLVGVGRDITERKQVEEQINDLLVFNEKILNNSPVGILTYKFTGECVFANEQAALIVGARVQELKAQNFRTIESWKKSGLYNLFEKAIASRASVVSDIHHISSFGREVWMTVHCTTFRSKEEDHVLLSIYDITERKQAEQSLLESQTKYQNLVETSHDLIWTVDGEGRITFVNRAAKEIYGYEPDELIGRSFIELMDPEHYHRNPEAFKEAIAGIDESQSMESYVRHRDGSQIILSANSIINRDDDGNVTGVSGSSRNITKSKQTELERQVLLEIMQGLANTDDLQEFLMLIHAAIAKVIYAENCFVVLHQPDTGLFEEIYSVDQFDPPAPPARLEKSVTSYVFRSGESLLLTKERFNELIIQGEVELVGTNSESWLGIPLKTTSGTIGVIAVQDYENANRYTEHDKDFLSSIASQVALAIERKRADDELKQKNDDLALLNTVNEAVVRGQTLDSIVELLSSELKRIFSSVGSTIYMLSPDKQSIIMQQYSFSPEIAQKVEKLLGFTIPRIEIPVKEGGYFHKAMTSRRSAITVDPQEIQNWIAEFAETKFLPHGMRAVVRRLIPHIYRLLNIKSTIVVPLLSEDETIGFLDVSSSDLFTVNDLKRVERIGGQLTAVIQRQRAEAAEREQRVLAEALRDTSQILSSTLDYGEVLDHILTAVERVVPHDAATIMLINGDSAHVVRSHGYDEHGFHAEIMGIRLPLAETNNLRQMLETGQTLIIYDTQAYEGWKRKPITDWLRANVGAPISIQGEIIGFILLDSVTVGFFTPVHAKRLEAFANQAAIAIHNARLLQQAQEEIHERKRADQALRESEAIYRRAIEIAGSVPYYQTYDREGRANKFEFIGEGIRQITGYGPEEIDVILWDALTEEIILVEDLAGYSLEEGVQRVRSGEIPIWKSEQRIRDREGNIHWVFEAAVELYDENGISQGSIGTFQDITARKQVEESIKAEREKLQKYLDIAGVMLLALNQDGTVVLINQKGCEVLGYSYEEIIGRDWIDTFLTEPSREELHKVFRQLISGDAEKNAYYENTVLTKNGEERLIAWNNTLLRDAKGTITSTLSSGEDITERRWAENKLRESEERFRQLATNIEEAFWITDTRANKEIYISPVAATIWGNSVEYFMQNPDGFLNSIMKEDQAPVLAALEKQRKGEKTEIEYRILHADGSTRWIWDRAFPVFDENGNVKIVAGIAADITQRKQNEIARLESQARYHDLFDSSPISLWEEDYSLVKQQIEILQQNGVTNLEEYLSTHPEIILELASLVKVTDVNRVSLQLYHAKQKEELLRSLPEFVSTVTLQHFQDEILSLIRTSRFEWEGKDEALDASELMVMVHGSVPPGYEETWSKVIVSITDITERTQMEEALRESEERFSNAFEFAPIGIALVSLEGQFVKVNQALCELLGYTRQELLTKTFQEITHLDDLETDLDYNDRMLRMEISSYTMEKRYFHKSGEVVWVLLNGSLVKASDGQPQYFIAQIQDITERKQSERDSTRHLAELEALYENGLAVGQLLQPSDIGTRVIETFARHLSWHHVAIRLLRSGTDDLEVIAFNQPGLSDEEKLHMERHFNQMISKTGQGLSGWAVQTGVPFRTGNVHSHPQYVDTQAGIESGLYMPLKVGDRIIGVISVESDLPNAFKEQDERLLATLASQAAVAFENARLYQKIQLELAERKKAEDALRTSETHYRDLADSITDILFEMDHDLRYIHWNKASEIFSGVPAQNAIGKSIHELFGNSEASLGREEIYRSVLLEQKAKMFQTEIVPRSQNQKRILEINAYPSARGISVVAKDVTERRRNETLLERRFELMEYAGHHDLNEMMQKTVDIISELTGSHIGFYFFVNQDQKRLDMQICSTETMLTLNIPQGEGMHLALDQAGVWAEAARQRRSVLHNDYESLTEKKGLPDGHIPISRELAVPVIRNEKLVALIGIGNKESDYDREDIEIVERFADYAWDITERKQMENQLTQERVQLARRVEERTADLSRANSNLARALRVKDEFLANMSHELRTPLNAILGLSESLGEQVAGPLNEKQQKYLTTINESGHHLLSLINDILDLAKIEAGQITLDINKVDVNSVCQASMRMVKQLAQKKNQDISFEIDDGIGLMWADERRLKQMLVNLLSNAVKFTPESSKLGLEVHGDRTGNKVTLTVWDNGVGISPRDMEKLFRPFVQLDTGLAREVTGTGLGLTLVAQMARLHGGSVTVQSQPGEGSRFSIQLPWEPAVASDAATRLRNTGKFAAINLQAKNKPTILLIEDTKEVVMMLTDYLEMAGYKIITAQDGVDGITQAKLSHPNLILMDIQMPRMDGFETTQKLRTDPEFKDTPIIALTALAMSNDRQRCLEAGMDEYISKPVNLKALAKMIRQFLLESKESTAP